MYKLFPIGPMPCHFKNKNYKWIFFLCLRKNGSSMRHKEFEYTILFKTRRIMTIT